MAQKTPAAIKTESDAQIAAAGAKGITPSILNGIVQDIADSFVGSASPTFNNTVAFNDFSIFGTDTGSPFRGQLSTYKTSWAVPNGAWNDWFHLQIDSVSVTGGTLPQRQAAEQHGIAVVMTASAANGMAGSHAIPFLASATIPAGLPDGGSTPANANYQEIGAFAGNTSILSDGHYSEGIASYGRDNDGVNFAKAHIVTFFSSMNKGKADNSYPYYGVQAYSNGAQQTTFAPDAAFRVDGGWRYNLDLRGNAYSGVIDIALQNGHTITHDASNTYLNSGTSNAFNSSGFATKNISAAGTITATNGYIYQGTNMAGAAPSAVQGLALGWNQSNGQGENNIVDCYNGANGGFWFQTWSGAALTTLCKLNGSGLVLNVGFSSPIATKTANYTQTAADVDLIFNGAGSLTLTLLSAATYTGRELYVRTIVAQAVVSASSNVVPLAGGAAGTAILAATAGKWARLKSDGANWQIMASN